VERVGRHDNFFELGGHSLHGIKLTAKVEEQLGVSLPVIALFNHPTIQEMAVAVESTWLQDDGPPDSEGQDYDEGVLSSIAMEAQCIRPNTRIQ